MKKMIRVKEIDVLAFREKGIREGYIELSPLGDPIMYSIKDVEKNEFIVFADEDFGLKASEIDLVSIPLFDPDKE